jgi:hypothetical protein
VAATTLPTFLRRRQTELKIAVPTLLAIVLALLLVLSRRSSDAHRDDEAFGSRPLEPTTIDLVPAAIPRGPEPASLPRDPAPAPLPRGPEPARLAAPPPVIHPMAEPDAVARPARPSSVTVVSGTTAPGTTLGGAAPARPLPPEAAEPLRVPIHPVAEATTAVPGTAPGVRAGSRTEAAPAAHKPPGKRHRPSLKQIGIEE